ncbi:MAG: anhydro-N-acetylmuramic acid kinase [Aphanocapsa sp. GSE-SYN-MK-11-07L]|jgi:anhydro-N-acetylmuramic acid kinase|nr:anhydro-N-acetylmuramic acid kinase [Aphanocapsa sp. GSE-SYN-MK-11-07L]
MVRAIGLMSGTSVDGIDAALVNISGLELDLEVELLATQTYPYPPELRSQILKLCAGQAVPLEELSRIDDAIAQAFAQAALQIQADREPADLIGSHGQTVYHRPPQAGTLGYTVQLGRGEAIAQATGIRTVSNFRVADIAAGGQGAPLVSRIDACLLSHPTESRCVQNIGGIGNLTYLPAVGDLKPIGQGVKGWDTGPGNVLIDLAVQHFSGGQQQYDQDGAWAATGTPCHALVEQWLQQDFFQQPPPKSTGRELFGTEYFADCLRQCEGLGPADVLATLTELTAASIVFNYQRHLSQLPDRVLLCGGGACNPYLKQRLASLLHPIPVGVTDEMGLSGNAKEAIAFAVLAYWRCQKIPGNLPAVTGAKQEALLGIIHKPD